MRTIHAAVVQMRADDDHARCMRDVTNAVVHAARQGARLVVLPENYAGIASPGAKRAFAAEPGDPAACSALAPLCDLSARHGLTIVAGGTPERAVDGRLFNTAFVIVGGAIRARYRKLHLFDADIPGQPRLRESDDTAPGDTAVVIRTRDARIGLSICYDLRFPELYRALVDRGAELLVVPAAFTRESGAAHWQTLVRARAIECQAFVLAATQHGEHGRGRSSHGHAMIVDPWGRVLAQADGEHDAVLCATLEPEALAAARERIPVARHRRAPSELLATLVEVDPDPAGGAS